MKTRWLLFAVGLIPAFAPKLRPGKLTFALAKLVFSSPSPNPLPKERALPGLRHNWTQRRDAAATLHTA